MMKRREKNAVREKSLVLAQALAAEQEDRFIDLQHDSTVNYNDARHGEIYWRYAGEGLKALKAGEEPNDKILEGILLPKTDDLYWAASGYSDGYNFHNRKKEVDPMFAGFDEHEADWVEFYGPPEFVDQKNITLYSSEAYSEFKASTKDEEPE